MSENGIGSRPAASHAASMRAFIGRSSSSVANEVLYSSAQRAASAAARGPPLPPISSGGCGCLERLRLGVERVDPVVLAGERERPLGPLAVHDLELLGEHPHALAERREREAVGGVLALVPARAEAELDAPARHVVGGHDDLRDVGGVAERDRGDERAEPQRARVRGERRERRPRVERAALLHVIEVELVVGAEQRRHAVRLARLRERQPLGPGDAVLALDHQAEVHRPAWCQNPP